MHISSTKKILIIFILINILGIVGYGFTLQRVMKQGEVTNTLAQDLAYEIDREEKLRSLGKLLGDVSEDKSLIETQFVSPNEDELVEYITRIESLTAYTPVTLEVISVSTENEGDIENASLNVRISVSGSKEATLQLIKLIETLSVVTTVDVARVNITYSEDTQEKWNTSLTLRALMSG